MKLLRDTGYTGITVDRALIPDVMVTPGSSGSLQMLDHTLATLYLPGLPYYKGHCKVMRVSSAVYPVIIGNMEGEHQMLPDPDWKAEDQRGARARTSVAVGCMPSWIQRISQASSRRILTLLHKMSKRVPQGECVLLDQFIKQPQAKESDKIHQLKVKEAMSSVDKSTIEDL